MSIFAERSLRQSKQRLNSTAGWENTESERGKCSLDYISKETKRWKATLFLLFVMAGCMAVQHRSV